MEFLVRNSCCGITVNNTQRFAFRNFITDYNKIMLSLRKHVIFYCYANKVCCKEF